MMVQGADDWWYGVVADLQTAAGFAYYGYSSE